MSAITMRLKCEAAGLKFFDLLPMNIQNYSVSRCKTHCRQQSLTVQVSAVQEKCLLQCNRSAFCSATEVPSAVQQKCLLQCNRSAFCAGLNVLNNPAFANRQLEIRSQGLALGVVQGVVSVPDSKQPLQTLLAITWVKS